MTKEQTFRAGFVALVGLPNAGKSTLLNALLGQKLAIVSPKPQTTRRSITAVITEADYQAVFLDTPGWLKPDYALHSAMMRFVTTAVADADLVMYVVAADKLTHQMPFVEVVKAAAKPVLLVFNKMDIAPPDFSPQALIDQINPLAVFYISAEKNEGLEKIHSVVAEHLPFNPAYYDEDTLTDLNERFFAREFIREKVFIHCKEEVPYATEVSIQLWQERPNLTYIDAEIHVEKKTQKAILIGKHGKMLQKIGTEARLELETFLERKVYLNLYVRVSEDWKHREHYLKAFGYR